MIKFKINLLIICYFLFHLSVSANNLQEYAEVYIQFSKSSLTIQQALQELDKLPEISLVYNGNEEFLDVVLTLPLKKISVSKALEEIKKQAPVSIVFKNGHILIKANKQRVEQIKYRLL